MKYLLLLIFSFSSFAATVTTSNQLSFANATRVNAGTVNVGSIVYAPTWNEYKYQWTVPSTSSVPYNNFRLLSTNDFQVFPGTVTTASWVQPAVGDNVTITVYTNLHLTTNRYVYVLSQNSKTNKYFLLSKPTTTTILVRNDGDAANDSPAANLNDAMNYTVTTTNIVWPHDEDSCSTDASSRRTNFATTTWKKLILNAVDASSGATIITNIFIQPGNYTALGVGCWNNRIHAGFERLTISYYNTNSPSPTIPYYSLTNRVLIEGFIFAGGSPVTLYGLSFNDGQFSQNGGVGLTFMAYNTGTATNRPQFNVVDNCSFGN